MENRETYFTTDQALEYIAPRSRSTLWRHARPAHSGSGVLPAQWAKTDLDRLIARYTIGGE